MRKLIAHYRFQIAFVFSLALHFSAFLLCPHFGGEQGDTQNIRTVNVSFEDSGSFKATVLEDSNENSSEANFEETVYKPDTKLDPTPDEESLDKNIAKPQLAQKKALSKSTAAHKKQKAGTSSTTGQSDGIEILSLQQATLLKKLPLPPYPAYARKRGFEGSVTVRVLINANGLIKDIKVERYEGSDLFVKSVLSTVKRSWQGVFAPHKKAGFYIDGWVEVTIPFRLR